MEYLEVLSKLGWAEESSETLNTICGDDGGIHLPCISFWSLRLWDSCVGSRFRPEKHFGCPKLRGTVLGCPDKEYSPPGSVCIRVPQPKP